MTYHLVFDKFPSPEGSRFIELEDSTGHSISAGEWKQRKDGYVELVLPAPAGWQDIATAPRDGTRIILATLNGFVGEGKWAEKFAEKFYPITEGGWYSFTLDRRIVNITHWQPLPSPPKPLSYEGEQS